MSARFEYAQVDTFAEVQRLAAEGWRVAAFAVVGYPTNGAVYLMERPLPPPGGAR